MFKISMRFLMALLIGMISSTYVQGDTIIRQSIFDCIQSPGSFATLTTLLSETQMDAQVNKWLDPRTIFAPTDKAFKDFSRLGLLDGQADNRKKFVNFFIVPRVVKQEEVNGNNATFTTLNGNKMKISQVGKILYGITVQNGVIYVIDTVPVDPDLQKIVFPDKK